MHRLLVALFLAAIAAAQIDPGTSWHFQIEQPTPGQRLLLHQHFDVLGACCGNQQTSGPLEVFVWPEELALFSSIVPDAKFVARGRPFAEIRAERQAASGSFVPDANYYTLAEIEAAMDALVAAYPTRAQKVDISALPGGVVTHQGRHLLALKVSDNVAGDEDEPAILIAAQHHARELNSPHMVIGAMQRILNGYATDPQLQAIVDGYELWFVPTVNPDGTDYVWTTDQNWRKNRRNNGTTFGVDNNRNYPFLWGLCGSSTTTSSETYRGPSAGSEPETVTMRNVVAWLRPECYLDFHSSGREVLRMWAPCATVSTAMAAFQQRYCDDLRTPMAFGTRDPSGSGEAPEDHYASGGTLSFLTEIGTAFQPVWSETVAEEARVWPGIRRALTTWRPALRGHVRSSLGLVPLVSTITFTPTQLNHGEVTKSRARDGRYGLWLPLGTWNVTFAAAGHVSKTTSVTVSSYDQPLALDVELEPTGPAATLTRQGTGQIGTSVTFTYTSPGSAGATCLFGWSLGTAPGIDLGGLRVVPLNNDFLMEAAIAGNPIFGPSWQTLDGSAQAQATLAIPNAAQFVGITTFIGGITWDPAWSRGIKTWSAPVAVTPIP